MQTPTPDGPIEPAGALLPPEQRGSRAALEVVVLLGLLGVALVLAGLVGGAKARVRPPAPPAVPPPVKLPAVPRPRPSSPPLRPPPARTPVAHGEARTFAREVEEALADGDSEWLDARFDIRGWLSRGRPGRIEQAVRAVEGLRRQGRGLGTILVSSLDQLGASARLLRVREREGKTTALFRLLGDEAFVYQELLLVQGDDGRPAIEDVVFFAHGARLSDVVVDPADEGRVGHLRSLAGAGRAKETLLALAALSPTLQERGDVLLLRLEAARELGGLEYDDAAHRIETAAARRPGLELLVYTLHHEREQHQRCAADLDALERAVGGDPYIDVLRADERLIADDLPGADRHAEAAQAAEPSLFDAHDVLLTVALRRGDHDHVLALMTHIEAEFGDPFDDLDGSEFEAFRASPQYTTWRERHPSPGPSAPKEAGDR